MRYIMKARGDDKSEMILSSDHYRKDLIELGAETVSEWVDPVIEVWTQVDGSPRELVSSFQQGMKIL